MGRELPRLSDDDVIDYQMWEAVLIAVRREDEETREAQQAAQKAASVGVAGHRDPEWLKRAAAAEGAP